VIDYFIKFQKFIANRIIWPYSSEQDSLYVWRAFILSSILVAALVFGLFALFSALILIFKENIWGLAIVDSIGFCLCMICLFVRRIRFEIRAWITLLGFYGIGIGVILSVGPLSGGPAWLFAFAVLAGVLIGSRAALVAVLMNAVSLGIIGFLMSKGTIGSEFPFFTTPQNMIAAGINFIVLNAITAVSVSALLKVLNSSEKRYRLIAKNVADVIWTTDMDLNFTYISPSVFLLSGETVEESMEKPLDQMLTPKSFLAIMALYDIKIKQLAAGDEDVWEPAEFEAEQYRKDGSTFWTSIHARLVQGPDNKPEGILGVTRDITERRKNEAEKINAQIISGEHKKLALVGRIAGKLAHDFNNVLGIIMGHTELALLKCRDTAFKKTFELILNQTIRGKNLTKNLIAFAKSPEPKQAFFFINEKVDFVLNLLINDLEGITVKKDGLEQVELIADPGMIEHCLVNLLQNSIHGVSLTDSPEITLRTYCSDKTVFIEIQDNGCGIPQKYIERIFEPSFTLKGSKDISGSYKSGIKGTGYGMANIKKYVELHKGNVMVESDSGSRTKVTISLPVIQRKLTRDEKTKLNNAKKYFGKSILLVEDEQAISEVQYNILSQAPCNHEVDIASKGQLAIEMFTNNRYDLVSLDYILPGKLNGMDVYHHIRETDKFVPILFISGNIDFLESIKHLKQKDSNIDHLSKPCRNLEYINSINGLLENNSMERT